MVDALLFDPYLFSNRQLTTQTALALTSLYKFIFPGGRQGNYRILSCRELEIEYSAIFHEIKLSDRLVESFLRLILSNAQPIEEAQNNLDELVLSIDELPEIHRILINLARNNPNVIIILAEKEQYPHSRLYEQKEEICKLLHREAFISLADFTNMINIFTEGKTDWMHLKAALMRLKKQGKYLGLQLDFIEINPDSGEGWSNLLQHCLFLSCKPEDRTNIFIFDRDVESLLPVKMKIFFSTRYHHWGNKVFSCLLPIPSHRHQSSAHVCIELYYFDLDIIRKDQNGNRLFLDVEFIYETGKHRQEELKCHHRHKILQRDGTTPKSILSGKDIVTFENKPVGLSKSRFAENILMEACEFQDMNISEFTKIFDLICEIRNEAKDYDWI